MLRYTYSIAQNLILSKEFRNKVLQLLLRIYEKATGGVYDYFSLCRCQFFLNVPEATASLLSRLLNAPGEGDYLIAYQIAFDIFENENQVYTTEVLNNVASSQEARLSTLKRILSGEVPRKHILQFLKKNNHTDMLLIKKMKEAIGEKNSVAHGACVWANAMMNCMTTNDSFLRDNLNWVGRATNWARFAATGSIGLIHIGNTAKALELLNPYLVGGGGDNSSPYSTSGAYYAYGMIHVN